MKNVINRLIMFLSSIGIFVYTIGSIVMGFSRHPYAIVFMIGPPLFIGLIWVVFGSKPFNYVTNALSESFK